MRRLQKKERGLKNEGFWRLVVSFAGSIGVFCWISLFSNDFTLANIFFVGALLFLNLSLRDLKNRKIVKFEAIYAGIISIFLVMGSQLNTGNHLYLSIRTCGALLFLPLAIYEVIAVAKKVLGGIFERGTCGELQKRTKRRLFAVLFGVNLLALVFLFPGIYTYDMASWNEQFSMGHLMAHWSITYNIILAFFLDLGGRLFGSYEIGFGIAMFLQAVLTSYVYYAVCCFVFERTKNVKALIASVAFFVINPFMVMMSVTNAQDVCFGCLLALFTIEAYKMLTNEVYFEKKTRIIKPLIICFLLITIRNNAVYCLLFAIPFLMILKTKCNKRPLLLILVLSFLFSIVYTGPFFALIGAEKGTSINEMLSVPSQQIAKVYYENRGSMTEEEVKKLSDYYDINGDFSLYEKYPLIADYTKKSLNSEYAKEHLGEYAALYLKIGIKNPKIYIEAFLLNSYGFWMPMKNYDDDRINLNYMNYPGFSMTSAFENPGRSSMKAVRRLWAGNLVARFFDSVMYGNSWYRIPIVSMLSSMGWYWMVLGYLILAAISKRKTEIVAAILPVIGLFATLLLAPVAIYRYIYPIAVLMPVFLALLGGMRKKRKTTETLNVQKGI